ncbi:Signal transduction histidine-protein kinase BarA [Caulifigura coniformis]|uniref:histidine kinase n=1 Tax=Caulifigura coniformis TaxID=2527983 RepID=A0A517S7J0_9PLAN|nr:PAS domain-containing protein [Caulifigura coniformis]QDT52085.1 Signal transduction histidine-protein kinase BarA [Caulifigura coniformis]
MPSFSVRVIALVLLTAGIAFVDAVLPAQMTASLLYVALVLLASAQPESRWTWIAFGVASVLSVIDFAMSPGQQVVNRSDLLGNLILTQFVLVVTAVLASRRRRVERRLRDLNAKLDENIARRTAELSRAVYDLQAEAISRARAQMELEHEASLLKGLMDAMPDHIYFKDRDGRYLRINSAKAIRSGLGSADEAVGKTDYDFFPKEHADKANAEEHRVMETGEPVLRQENRLVWPDGRVTWSSATKVPLRSKQGEIVGTLGISHDVTGHHELAETLQLERDRLRTLIDNLPDLIFIKDLNYELITVNRAYLEQFGLKHEDDVVGHTEFDFCAPNIAHLFRDADARVLSTGQSLIQQEEQYTAPDGSPQWKISTRIPLRDLSGKVIGLVGICHDITERKKSERALQKSEWLYHSLVDNLPVYVVRKDLEGRVTYANASACQLYGQSYDQVIGKTDYDFFPRHLAEKYRQDDQRVIESGESFADIEENSDDGRFNFFEVRKTPVRDLDGSIVGVQLMFWDVTVRQNALRALAEAKEAAESANRAKSEFLANMSHEIRTPMNAIIGMTELVLETRLMPEQRDFLQTVRDSGLALLNIINDILDFSKIEAGRLELEEIPFDLRETLGDALKAIGLRAHVKGLELACDIKQDVPRVLVGDPLRLRQVVINLVGNAVKFTERGEVVVTCEIDSAAPPSDGRARLYVTVRDTGIGITPDQQQRIFRAFEQADMSLTRRFGGTGLGLAISSRIVQQMGGRIWVDSVPGKGSEFHFVVDLPIGSPDDVASPPLDSSRLTGLRILVVDDNATNRRIIEAMCLNWHMLPTTVADAQTGLELLRKAARQGPAYDLVITDASMPDVDGFTFADHIHQDSDIRSTLVMMLTSLDRMGDATRCDELGIKSYLIKPVKQSDLFDAIVLALEGERRGPAVSPIAPETLPRLRPLNVLLAEDSLANQKLAKGLLTRWGHHLTIVNNGLEAVAAVRRRDFDLVLMDVQMPELDGIEATAQIRQLEANTSQRLPIIAMTAHAMKGDKERCLAAGMDGYCPKPVRPRELHDAIIRVLPSALPAGELPALNVASTHLQAAENRQPEASAAPLVDWTAALKSMQNDESLLLDVIDAHLSEIPQIVENLEAAISTKDAATVRRLAHTIKGNLRALHAHEPIIAADLEADASKDDLSRADELLAQVLAQLDAVNEQFRQRLQATKS